MVINKDAAGSNLILRLAGELDHHSSRLFREEFSAEWQKKDINNLILNFKKLTFMDSSGVGAIIGRYNQVKEKNGSVAVCGTSPSVKKLMEMSGLLKIVRLYDSENDALNDLSFK